MNQKVKLRQTLSDDQIKTMLKSGNPYLINKAKAYLDSLNRVEKRRIEFSNKTK